MAATVSKDVIGNWHKLIEGLQVSSREFYAAVQAGLARRRVPALKTRVVVRNEGGILSPRREYFRMTDGRVAFYLCAAPFGTGFFFSWWLVEVRASWVAVYGVLFVAATRWIHPGLMWGLTALRALSLSVTQLNVPRILSPVLWWWASLWVGWFFQSPSFLQPWFPAGVAADLAAWCASLWLVMTLVHLLARMGKIGPERAMGAIPILGRVYVRVFAPMTYYRLDTAMMLRGAVHAAVLEAIDGITTAKGLRALGEAERKPIMSTLLTVSSEEGSPAERSDVLEVR